VFGQKDKGPVPRQVFQTPHLNAEKRPEQYPDKNYDNPKKTFIPARRFLTFFVF
jgi:hypothetical protein